MGLQQHFRDAAGGAEVAVNLEWGMGVEQVGQGAFGCQLLREHGVGVVAIQQARPEINFPSHRPAGTVITTKQQGLFGGIKEFRRAAPGDFVAGMQSPEVRHMAVFLVRVVLVFQPFLQLAVLSDLIWRNSFSHILEF